MKIMPAVFFTCVGIWLAYNKPELAAQAYEYILFAINYAAQLIQEYL